ncbi:GroES-like protein [Artomyces pyxidatus]|uniref:GroES-like protein n=1 Tax=Artomyces pyxidatus TaxID=48021 RepID=A0ACB8T0J5_9AGAM|nr:GroES-like protein [Artomyces pyxidatus]
MSLLKQYASVVSAEGAPILKQVDIHRPGPGEVLIKVIAASQTPSDWKTAERARVTGAVLGLDYAGVVAEVGADVPETVRHVGERVCGFVHGGTTHRGSFCEYLVGSARYGIVAIPDSWSFEDAASVGCAGLTVMQSFYETYPSLPTPLAPAAEPFPILIYGGSSSVGIYAIQVAKLSGLHVIATASKRNFELLKSYGADEVYDYNDPDVGQKIKASTQGNLTHAMDTISEGNTGKIIADAFSDEGGVVGTILHYQSPRADIKNHFILAYQLLGEDFQFPIPYKVSSDIYALSEKCGSLLSATLALGKVKPMPTLIMPKGLASVDEGFAYMKGGKVSAQKITYRIADTPKE